MICIRQANETDYHAIMDVVKKAFRHERHSGCLSMAELDDADFFIPELSLVAEIDDHKIVGHIYLIEISIDYIFPSLGLVQVAVEPKYQGLGIGSMMVEAAHKRARELGYGSVISFGGALFLSKFGYRALANFDIHYGLVEDQCLVVELYSGAMTGVQGKVAFPLDYYKIILKAIAAVAAETSVASIASVNSIASVTVNAS